MTSLQRLASLQTSGANTATIQPTAVPVLQTTAVKQESAPQESYLSLLAQIAKKESDERLDNNNNAGNTKHLTTNVSGLPTATPTATATASFQLQCGVEATA